MSKEKPAYWAVLPASVRYDTDLPPNAKLLYAEISALANADGYCFATNEYFARNFNLNTKSIQRLLKALSDKNYILVVVDRDPKTNEVLERKIFVGINPVGESAPTSPQNCGDPSPQNCGDPSPQKSGDPSPQNCGVEYYKYINNIPPIVPQGDERVRKRKRKGPRDAPDWLPERFSGFWNFYPKKGRKDKQRAMDAWDKLHPSEELVDTIARSLVRLKGTEEWKRGIGIPYAATFLNGERWKDADELDTADDKSESDSGGWADDEEVL